jgi:hypothetical protein
MSFNHDDIHGVEASHQHSQAAHSGHSRQKSLANSDPVLNNFKVPLPNEPELEERPDGGLLTERRMDIIQMEERKFRDTTLDALRATLEEFSDEVPF